MAGQGENTIRDSKNNKRPTSKPVTTGGTKVVTLPGGTKVASAPPTPAPPIAGFSPDDIKEFIRTGKTPGGGIGLTPDQVAQVVNSVVASNQPTSTPLTSLVPTVAPVTTKTSTGGRRGGAKPASSTIATLYDQLIKEAEGRQFDTTQFDIKQKYLAEQIATAKAAKDAAEQQANLQYQALAQMAAEQQAKALEGAGAAYSDALAQMAAQGGAAAAIGGGGGQALQQQFAAQRMSDEQAMRDIGAAASGGVSSASALQQLLNQAGLRDLSTAQIGAEATLAAEQARALAAFDQQRQAELSDFRMKRAVEIQRQQEEARRAAAAAAAARAKAAASVATPGIDIGTTGLGARLNTAFGAKQVAKDPNTGKPLLDQNKKPIMQEWGSFVIGKTVDGKPTTIAVNTAAMAGDVANLGLAVNYIMTDTTGKYTNYTPQQRVNEATALVNTTKKSLTEAYGGNAVYDAWKAPVGEGGLGLPATADGFIRLTVGK